MKRFVQKYLSFTLVAFALAFVCPNTLMAASPAWELTSQAGTDTPAQDAASPAISDVSARGEYIYVTVTRPIPVRVINILGQTISSQSLQRGTSRLRVTTRGVYIIRAENITRRVTV